MEQKLRNGILDQANSRISYNQFIALPLVQNNPMISIPMTNQREGNRIEII